MFSNLLGSFGFFIFFVFILIAVISKKQKKMPTIGFIVTMIFIIGVLIPIPISASNDNSNNVYKNVVAGKSVNTESENSISRNIVNSNNDARQINQLKTTNSSDKIIDTNISLSNKSNNIKLKKPAGKEIHAKPKQEPQKVKLLGNGTKPQNLVACGQVAVELTTYKTSLNSDNTMPLVTTYNDQVNNTASNINSNADNKNNITKVSTVDNNSGETSKYNITKEQGLKIVTSKVNIAQGLQVLYDSERVIKENTYHLYTLNTDEDTLEDVAYCVNVNSGKLFKCSIDMALTAIE